jgi:hypothetical protein
MRHTTGRETSSPYPGTLLRVADPSTFRTYHQKTHKFAMSAYMNSPQLRQLAALAKGIQVNADRGIPAGSRRAFLCGSLVDNNP